MQEEEPEETDEVAEQEMKHTCRGRSTGRTYRRRTSTGNRSQYRKKPCKRISTGDKPVQESLQKKPEVQEKSAEKIYRRTST